MNAGLGFRISGLMTRVVKRGISLHDTPVVEAMTRNPIVAPLEVKASDSFEFMTDKHFRRLPITDHLGKLVGMLSVRHLMRSIVENFAHELEIINSFEGGRPRRGLKGVPKTTK